MYILFEIEILDYCCQFVFFFDSGEYSVVMCLYFYDVVCVNCNDLYYVIEGIKQVVGEVEFESEDQKDDIYQKIFVYLFLLLNQGQ